MDATIANESHFRSFPLSFLSVSFLRHQFLGHHANGQNGKLGNKTGASTNFDVRAKTTGVRILSQLVAMIVLSSVAAAACLQDLWSTCTLMEFSK